MQHLIQRHQAATFKPYSHCNRIAFDLDAATICEQSHNDIAKNQQANIAKNHEKQEEEVKMTTALTIAVANVCNGKEAHTYCCVKTMEVQNIAEEGRKGNRGGETEKSTKMRQEEENNM